MDKLTELDEKTYSTMTTWSVEGPGGRLWAIVWTSGNSRIFASPFPHGRTRYEATATDLDAARTEALRIAGLIAGKKA